MRKTVTPNAAMATFMAPVTLKQMFWWVGCNGIPHWGFIIAQIQYISHRIHVWYIYVHFAWFLWYIGTCRWIYHTWMVWVVESSILSRDLQQSLEQICSVSLEGWCEDDSVSPNVNGIYCAMEMVKLRSINWWICYWFWSIAYLIRQLLSCWSTSSLLDLQL